MTDRSLAEGYSQDYPTHYLSSEFRTREMGTNPQAGLVVSSLAVIVQSSNARDGP